MLVPLLDTLRECVGAVDGPSRVSEDGRTVDADRVLQLEPPRLSSAAEVWRCCVYLYFRCAPPSVCLWRGPPRRARIWLRWCQRCLIFSPHLLFRSPPLQVSCELRVSLQLRYGEDVRRAGAGLASPGPDAASTLSGWMLKLGKKRKSWKRRCVCVRACCLFTHFCKCLWVCLCPCLPQVVCAEARPKHAVLLQVRRWAAGSPGRH